MKWPTAILIALGFLVGCTSAPRSRETTSTNRFGYTGHLHCRRVSELASLQSCRATVEKIQPCGVLLRTDDGKSLSLAGPMGGDPEVIRFMRTLKAGHTYSFPRAFLEFQQQNKEPNDPMQATPNGAPDG